jgi:hypothetical protein
LTTRRGTSYRVCLVAMWWLAKYGRISMGLMVLWSATSLAGFSGTAIRGLVLIMMRLSVRWWSLLQCVQFFHLLSLSLAACSTARSEECFPHGTLSETVYCS